jgi:hypothetical protein
VVRDALAVMVKAPGRRPSVQRQPPARGKAKSEPSDGPKLSVRQEKGLRYRVVTARVHGVTHVLPGAQVLISLGSRLTPIRRCIKGIWVQQSCSNRRSMG